MKKCLLIILSSLVCLFSYSANVPKVNNHGFPQNLKSSQKEIVIGNDSLSKTQLNNTIIEKGQTPQEKKVSIKKSQKKKIIDSKEVVNSNDKVSKNSHQKKEIKTQKRELKKELKDLIRRPCQHIGSCWVMSCSCVIPCSMASYVCWIDMFYYWTSNGNTFKRHKGSALWSIRSIILLCRSILSFDYGSINFDTISLVKSPFPKEWRFFIL